MLRLASILALVSGLCSLMAFRSEDPFAHDRPFPVNSTVARFFLDNERYALPGMPGSERPEMDTSSQLRVLLLNYSAYDSAYVNKIHRAIQQQIPACQITDFWDGSASDLNQALGSQDVVVISYPAAGNTAQLKAYASSLSRFLQQGGGIIVTGTHEFSVLQQMNLFDLDFGYYCKNRPIHSQSTDHPILNGISSETMLNNYLYPLDVSDPAFVTLADVGGYPVVGYKPVGAGKVAYIGIEYYYEEEQATRLLQNTIIWMAGQYAQAAVSGNMPAGSDLRPRKRTEEYLYAGSSQSRSEQPVVAELDLKIYPNPYMEKGNLDINLNRATQVSVEMTDESGRIVAVLLPRRSLNTGTYRLELPNVAPGIYFIQCQTGESNTVRKVVKSAR
jgi:hypothetical protein